MVKKNSCVFISGNGTNLKALLKNSKEYNFPIRIKLVISSNKKAKGIRIAKMYGTDTDIYNFNNKLKNEIILNELKKRKIKLICLAGFMKILSADFIKRFKGKIINIHPSLLPKHKGLNTFEKSLKAKDRLTGCTVHYVNEHLDSGKTILQSKVTIKKNDNIITLKAKVQKEEYVTYSKAIIKIYNSINF